MVAAFLLLTAAVSFLIQPNYPSPVNLPNPNGYDDLMKAAQMFVGELPECYWSQSLDDECVEATKGFLKTNSEALKLVRLGLSRESRVPIVYTTNYFSQHASEYALLKRLAQNLAAEGKVAEKENRVDDAIQSHLDAARLHEKTRGGVLIDSLVGIACEAIGVGALRKLSDQMTPPQRRTVIGTLSQMHTNRDSYDEIMAREKRLIKAYGLREQFEYWTSFLSWRETSRNFERKLNFVQARCGLFLVDLGVRNFEADNNRQPETLQELVPKYLPYLPKDDFSGSDFIYRPSTNGYQLYGVGPDGIDDGGKPFFKKGMNWPGDMLPNAQY